MEKGDVLGEPVKILLTDPRMSMKCPGALHRLSDSLTRNLQAVCTLISLRISHDIDSDMLTKFTTSLQHACGRCGQEAQQGLLVPLGTLEGIQLPQQLIVQALSTCHQRFSHLIASMAVSRTGKA